jgi:hypothetical protein
MTNATQISAIEKQEAVVAAAIAKLDKLRKQESAAALIANVQAGDVITFVFGRKAGRAEFTGEVRSVTDTDKGRVIRVIKGAGLDEEIVSIRPGDIVGKGVVSRGDVAEPTAQPQAANDDPLAALQ